MIEKENLSLEHTNAEPQIKTQQKSADEKDENNIKIQYKNRGITKYEFKLIWSVIAFLFIFGLCWLFNSPEFLWMLLGWLLWMF